MLLAVIASGSLRPALQPDGVPQPSPGPTGQWTLHPGGLNCYDGHGAPGASGSPHAEPITLDECKSACLAASGCQAVVVDVKKFEVSLRPPRPDAPAQSKLVSCFLREEVRPEERTLGGSRLHARHAGCRTGRLGAARRELQLVATGAHGPLELSAAVRRVLREE